MVSFTDSAEYGAPFTGGPETNWLDTNVNVCALNMTFALAWSAAAPAAAAAAFFCARRTSSVCARSVDATPAASNTFNIVFIRISYCS